MSAPRLSQVSRLNPNILLILLFAERFLCENHTYKNGNTYSALQKGHRQGRTGARCAKKNDENTDAVESIICGARGACAGGHRGAGGERRGVSEGGGGN